MQFEVAFARVFGVETENSAEGRLLITQTTEMTQLCLRGIDDFANDRRCARVIPGRATPGGIDGHVGVDIAVRGNAAVWKNKVPRPGERWILRSSEGRDRHRIRFPQTGHHR